VKNKLTTYVKCPNDNCGKIVESQIQIANIEKQVLIDNNYMNCPYCGEKILLNKSNFWGNAETFARKIKDSSVLQRRVGGKEYLHLTALIFGMQTKLFKI